MTIYWYSLLYLSPSIFCRGSRLRRELPIAELWTDQARSKKTSRQKCWNGSAMVDNLSMPWRCENPPPLWLGLGQEKHRKTLAKWDWVRVNHVGAPKNRPLMWGCSMSGANGHANSTSLWEIRHSELAKVATGQIRKPWTNGNWTNENCDSMGIFIVY